MQKTSILVLVGSLRRDSTNRKLAELAPQGFVLEQARIDDLPLYDQDDDDDPAESVVRLKRAITAEDGLIFVTPEYNRSIPGVLKNAIDHASRPYGQSAWAGKPAGVLGASIGPQGTSMAQQHLRNVLAYLDVPTLGQPEAFVHAGEGYFDERGRVASPKQRAFLETWMKAYVAWVEQHTA